MILILIVWLILSRVTQISEHLRTPEGAAAIVVEECCINTRSWLFVLCVAGIIVEDDHQVLTTEFLLSWPTVVQAAPSDWTCLQ
jgi:hypothetical protein